MRELRHLPLSALAKPALARAPVLWPDTTDEAERIGDADLLVCTSPALDAIESGRRAPVRAVRPARPGAAEPALAPQWL